MERYEIVKDIGSGNFGVAKLVKDKWSGELYAIKFIERGQKVETFFFSSPVFPCSKSYCFGFKLINLLWVCLSVHFYDLSLCLFQLGFWF